MSTTPLVNIVMPTYNHERFVAQAIESVLAQQTEFAYKLMVGDDCSTDGTQAVVRSYAEKYPDKIEFAFSRKNLGIFHRDRVSLKLMNECTAKYVGILEGDDYWTDPRKLQKQVDYLEAHDDCAVCFHNARMLSDNPAAPQQNYCSADQKEVSNLVDIVERCFLIPCTALFRNKLWGELPDSFYSVLNGDWMLFVLIAEHGYLGYLNEVMAVYRVHSGGIWSRLTRAQGLQEHIKTYRAIDKYLNYTYADIVGEKVAALQAELDQLALLEKQLARQRARASLDDYHKLARNGQMSKALTALSETMRSDLPLIMDPHRAAAIIKNGLLGLLSFSRNPSTLKDGSRKEP